MIAGEVRFQLDRIMAAMAVHFRFADFCLNLGNSASMVRLRNENGFDMVDGALRDRRAAHPCLRH